MPDIVLVTLIILTVGFAATQPTRWIIYRRFVFFLGSFRITSSSDGFLCTEP